MQPPTNRSVRVVTSLLTPASDKREELVQTLRSLRDRIAREPGCVVCVVCQDIDGGDHFVVLSEWRSQEDLMAHIDSEHFRVLSGASRLLGATAEFRFVTSSTPASGAIHP